MASGRPMKRGSGVGNPISCRMACGWRREPAAGLPQASSGQSDGVLGMLAMKDGQGQVAIILTLG
jgi:hypothetical protein